MAPTYTASRRRRPVSDDSRGPVRAGLAKRPTLAGLTRAATTGELSVTRRQVAAPNLVRTANANTILDPASEKAVAARRELIDPSEIVKKALAGLTRATGPPQFSGATAAAGPRGVLNIAKKYLGVPYRWGGTNPATGLDCSGYVQLVFRQLGVNLPRVSRDQAKVGRTVNGIANARPGDLVFYASNGVIHHDGIYAGNGMYYNSPHTGAVVRLAKVGTPYLIKRVL